MDNFKTMIDGDRPVLVDFFATWCGPCKVMHPILEELKKEMGDGVRILKVDIDSPKNQQLVQLYNVQSVPTMFLFKKGQIRWKQVGAIGLEPIREIVKRNM
ncbi:MAG: thioredoxin [Rikenellaceae bacterium]|jgi:thioredoxin 1|nr:thioredoxin [Rikenellaceae bacterium]